MRDYVYIMISNKKIKQHLRILLLVISNLPILVQAQKATNVTGNTLKGNEVTYAYSVGEVIGFSLIPNCAYTQGVIQPAKFSFSAAYKSLFNSYQISLYPNPARDFILIETDCPDLATYQITAFDGKVVETNKFNYTPIDIRRLQAGIYSLTLFSSDHKKRKTFKIMKL